jgi:hypothetical protein
VTSYVLGKRGSVSCRDRYSVFIAGSRLTLLLIKWVLGVIFKEVKRLEREENYSPPSTAEVKNDTRILSLSYGHLGRDAV